jgi:DNA-binding NarL/FixJ family response regulator
MTSSPFPSSHHFLVIDHHHDRRFLLVKSLLRKFPNAVIDEMADGEPAITLASERSFDAIIIHRTSEFFGVELVEKLRAANPKVPIVMVSSIDRAEAAYAVGADAFLLFDEWLRIGSVVRDLLEKGSPPAKTDLPTPAKAKTDLQSS